MMDREERLAKQATEYMEIIRRRDELIGRLKRERDDLIQQRREQKIALDRIEGTVRDIQTLHSPSEIADRTLQEIGEMRDLFFQIQEALGHDRETAQVGSPKEAATEAVATLKSFQDTEGRTRALLSPLVEKYFSNHAHMGIDKIALEVSTRFNGIKREVPLLPGEEAEIQSLRQQILNPIPGGAPTRPALNRLIELESRRPSYVPQDIAHECLEMLRQAGLGNPGTTNTLWGMIRQATTMIANMRSGEALLREAGDPASYLEAIKGYLHLKAHLKEEELASSQKKYLQLQEELAKLQASPQEELTTLKKTLARTESERTHYMRGVANWLGKSRRQGRPCGGCFGCGDDSLASFNACHGSRWIASDAIVKEVGVTPHPWIVDLTHPLLSARQDLTTLTHDLFDYISVLRLVPPLLSGPDEVIQPLQARIADLIVRHHDRPLSERAALLPMILEALTSARRQLHPNAPLSTIKTALIDLEGLTSRSQSLHEATSTYDRLFSDMDPWDVRLERLATAHDEVARLRALFPSDLGSPMAVRALLSGALTDILDMTEGPLGLFTLPHLNDPPGDCAITIPQGGLPGELDIIYLASSIGFSIARRQAGALHLASMELTGQAAAFQGLPREPDHPGPAADAWLRGYDRGTAVVADRHILLCDCGWSRMGFRGSLALTRMGVCPECLEGLPSACLRPLKDLLPHGLAGPHGTHRLGPDGTVAFERTPQGKAIPQKEPSRDDSRPSETPSEVPISVTPPKAPERICGVCRLPTTLSPSLTSVCCGALCSDRTCGACRRLIPTNVLVCCAPPDEVPFVPTPLAPLGGTPWAECLACGQPTSSARSAFERDEPVSACCGAPTVSRWAQ